MVAQRRIQSFDNNKIFKSVFAVIIGLFICGSIIFAAEEKPVDKASYAPLRYMSRSLRHISAEEGKKYLAEAGVGTASQLPNTNMLLVTGHPLDLIKASEILKLVDSKESFIIRVISPASEAHNLPSNEDIAPEVGGITIGTFSEPPPSGVESRAIIDVHQDSVITVAPLDKIDEIIAVIERLKKTSAKPGGKIVKQTGKVTAGPEIEQPVPQIAQTIKTPDEPELEVVVETKVQRRDVSDKPAERAEKSEPEPDELFDKLLDSLAEAEATMAELERTRVEPDEAEVQLEPAGKIETKPSVAPTLPTQLEKRKPLVTFEQPVTEPEEVLQQPKQLQAAEFTTVIEKMVAEEVARRLAAEAPQEPTEPNEEVLVPDVAVGRSYQPKVTIDGNEMLDLNLPDKLEIIDLLGLVGEYLKVDYLYDPAKVKGAVTLRLRGPIKVKDLYPLLESVLKFQGFVMTRKDNLVRIVPETDVLNIDPVIIDEEKGGIEVGDVIVTRLFRLKYIDTESAKNLLDGMKLGVNINTSASDVGVLIVTGYAHRMARIEKLLDMVDKPGEQKEFRFRKLEYTMAATLAPKVKALAEQLGTVTISISQAPAAPKKPPTKGRTPPRARKQPQRRPTPQKGAPTGEGVYLDFDERTNRILMIGLEEQLAVVDKLIDTLDVEQADLRTLRLYDIQNVGAEEVLEKLNELGIISSFSGTSRRGGSRIGGGRPTAAGSTAAAQRQRQQAAAQTGRRGAGTEEALEQEPQVVVIESTNSLLANATDEQHARIAMIIGYVDNETLERAIPYKIYSLENQSPVDVADVLNKLIQETVTDKAGKIEQVIQKQDEDIVIVPDENTFSLIVYASKKNQEWIGNLIKNLDKRRPQVLIDVSLVEITRNEDFEYDLNIISNAKDAVVDNIVVKSATGLPASAGYALEGAWNLTDADGLNTYRTQAFYSDKKIQAVFSAMDTKDYGRILARPKVLVNDNEQGLIRTTQKTYVSETSMTYGSQQAEQPLTSTTWTPYEAKIELTITPHISEGDLLRLEVEMIREDFLETTEGGPPDYTTSNINTIVTVPDKSTIILGGLTKLNQGKGGSKVPLLGDIPLVGALFRSVSNANDERQLYIFVKADILRPDDTLEGSRQLVEISKRNKVAFERAERLFQEHQDIPGIKPDPIDPIHVLESE